MTNAITDTAEIAETEWDGHSEPSYTDNDLRSTVAAEGKGIEFHVSMHSHTMRDMEELIVESAARLIVGKHTDNKLAKSIEQLCMALVTEKANAALQKVTNEIIDQPLTPSFGDKKPVTMREFIGLTGREYLSQSVDWKGSTEGSSYDKKQSRMEYLISKFMDAKFKAEIEKSTDAAVREMQAQLKARYVAILEAEKQRFQEALAKISAA